MFDLWGIQNGSERALERIIDKYSAYVCTIIRNTVGESLSHEDIEELASDVFLALWNNAAKIKGDNLKSYLGKIAHNLSINRLRMVRETLPLDDEIIGSTEDELIGNEEREAVKSAVLAMNSPDREIFLRYYYNAEPVALVARSTGLTEAAVKHRLARGREKLAKNFIKEGIYE
ncbi:MAG: sigma-70 family RNA polymerase sigma factor [Ruminococcus sp.]|jgi:RNA polymerase sigma-70 factor (ECF subfamily)|nr:sigma-70 family RNA polymerase sigma factor [Ruminococcus sp.]